MCGDGNACSVFFLVDGLARAVAISIREDRASAS